MAHEIENDQQMAERQPLLPSQPSDLSFNLPQQEHEVEDEVTIRMKENFQDCGDGILLSDCCIYRVPIILRRLKEEAYTPKVVSIGPFHYRDEKLQDMERHKPILFRRFTRRATPSLDDLVHCVKHLEPKVRASYSETIDLTEQDLVRLTLMDAGFIIELFMMLHEQDYGNDAKLSQPWLDRFIHHDLVLLENQLPFFVIEELFNEAFPEDSRGSLPSFLELTYEYFGYYNKQNLVPNSNVKTKHFTDLIRSFHLQREIPKQSLFSDKVGMILLYNVKKLQEAGIELKVSMSDCLLDLKFSGHNLEIPKIFVEDSTELLFRNMIALEQCHYPYKTYITDYTTVLDCLIDTDEDVDLLVHKEIVSNYLGDSNSVTLLFNGLGKNVTQATINSEYLDTCKRLNEYCKDPWHEMKATLKRDYCRTPWQIVASIAAIVLLILTVVQTICSILQE